MAFFQVRDICEEIYRNYKELIQYYDVNDFRVEINLRDSFIKDPQNRQIVEDFEDKLDEIKLLTFLIPINLSKLTRMELLDKVTRLREDFSKKIYKGVFINLQKDGSPEIEVSALNKNKT